MVGRCARCTGPRIDVVKRHERGCSELHGFKTRTVFCRLMQRSRTCHYIPPVLTSAVAV